MYSLRHFCFFALIITFGFTARSEFKVLFIGNSFTLGSGGTQSVATIFDALANAAGQEDPTTVMRAVGGKDYQYHYENSQTEIAQDLWTHVVLQNYSTGPTSVGDIPAHMTYGELLYDSIIANHAATRVHLYETWARPNLIPGTFATAEEMLGELRTNYHALADVLTEKHPENAPVKVNPVGESFYNAGGNLDPADPDYIDLWDTDNYHADNRGYYLSACVHYASIYRVSPEGLYTQSPVSSLGLNISADAAFLETTAWKTVLDWGLADRVIRIDLGADGTTTPDTGTYWNNLTATQAGVDGTLLSGLIESDGTASSVDLTVVSKFHAAFDDGSAASTLYPSSASADTLYGDSGLTPELKLSGLDPSTALRLTFYASGTDTGDNLQTRYTVTGDRTVTADLDPAGNVDSTANTDVFFPDASGEVTITLSAGPDNDSPELFTRLGVLEITSYPETDIAFISHPQSQSVEANNPVTFTAETDAGRYTTAQWYRDGILIPDATELTYTLYSAAAAYQGSEFTVRVSNGFSEIESNPATLSIQADVTEPAFLNLQDAGGLNLQLIFSEPLSATEATDPSNYRVVNRGRLIPVTAATLSADGSTVELTLETSPVGNIVVESAYGLKDLAGNSLSGEGLQTTTRGGGDGVILIDFGTNATPSVSETWNSISMGSSIRSSVGNGTGTPYTYTSDLLNSNGGSTGVALVMTDTMTGENTAGTSSGTYPSETTRDNFYGNTGVWSGFTGNGQGIFVFSNLDPAQSYNFTFFASRTGVSDNRETLYQLAGASTVFTTLNASNNISNTAALTGVVPNASGEITLTLSKGPNNNNANGFYYLNVLEITLPAETPQLYAPVWLSAGVVLDWTGGGSLFFTDDLELSWTAVDPEPEAPFVEPLPLGNVRFYRVAY